MEEKKSEIQDIANNIQTLCTVPNYCNISQADSADSHLMIPVGGEIVEAKRSKGFETFNGMDAGGYIVTLKEYTVRPAGKEDITYQ